MKNLLILLFTVCSTISAFAQSDALTRLENSPRHHEWVKLSIEDREIQAFVVYPEISGKATAIQYDQQRD